MTFQAPQTAEFLHLEVHALLPAASAAPDSSSSSSSLSTVAPAAAAGFRVFQQTGMLVAQSGRVPTTPSTRLHWKLHTLDEAEVRSLLFFSSYAAGLSHIIGVVRIARASRFETLPTGALHFCANWL
jgi:hypothetical protein